MVTGVFRPEALVLMEDSELVPFREGLERGEGAVLAGDRSSDGESRELISMVICVVMQWYYKRNMLVGRWGVGLSYPTPSERST